MSADRVRALADLVIAVGANVQPGQIVAISTEPGKEELTRELAASAYRAGAKFVDVSSFDYHVKRERLLHGREEDLDFVPPWYAQRLQGLSDARAARVGLTGAADPALFDGVDPARAGRDRLPSLREGGDVVNAMTTNWTAVPAPTAPWARLVHPDLPEDQALERLWEQLTHILRLDTPDPVAAWSERLDSLLANAERMTARRFDAIRFRGEGTDLTIGLLQASRWHAARLETVDGIVHVPNLPTEEVFTTPDPARAEGVVRSTKPLVLGGAIIRGLRVEFADGRVTKIDADENAEILRGYAASDEGASRLGEVALVDGEGRIGALDTVFYDTLLDENAASHIAIGDGLSFGVGDGPDADRLNHSAIHVDFMIGSPEMEVDGLTASGEAVAVLRAGSWQL